MKSLTQFAVLPALLCMTACQAPDPHRSLAQMIDAIEAEDYQAVRNHYHATSPTAVAAADDTVRMLVYGHRFQRVMKAHFPGRNLVFSEIGTPAGLQSMREELAGTTFSVRGKSATASRQFIGDRFVFDRGKLQVDVDGTPGLENYLGPNPGTGAAMMRAIARVTPYLNALADDIQAGRITSYEQVATLAQARAGASFGHVEREYRNHVAPVAVNLSTPQETVRSFVRAAEAEDPIGLRATLGAKTSSGIAFAEDFAALTVATRRFHRLMRIAFPGNAERVIWEGLSDSDLAKLREWAAGAAFFISGERTKAVGEGQFRGFDQFIRFDGEWKFDFDAYPDMSRYPQNDRGDSGAMMYLLASYAPELERVCDDMEAGKLSTVDAVKKAIDERSEPVKRRVDRELEALHASQGPSPESR